MSVVSQHPVFKSRTITQRGFLSRVGWILLKASFLLVFCVTSLQAQVDPSIDSVTLKDKEIYYLRAGHWEPATNVIKLPFEVEVKTNGVFTVAGGRERKLADGQVIRKDGRLVNPNGAVQAVFDHVEMLGGTATVIRDGKPEPLTETMTFPNQLTISPDGSVVYPSGDRSRLADGQLFRLDGTSVPAKDAVTMKDGHVVVQRGGKLIPLGPTQIMGMNDGSKVQGDGLVTKMDGTESQLTEGQTILIDGAAARH
jgi:hypothetical protein